MDVFDRTFVVSRSLTGVALAVAVLGLYAALTALQASREREFQLLGAIGYGRAETWRLAMAQSTILGAVAAVSAVPLGFVIAWLLCNVIQPLAFGWSIDLKADLAAITVPVVLGIAGAAAAVRGTRLPVIVRSARGGDGLGESPDQYLPALT